MSAGFYRLTNWLFHGSIRHKPGTVLELSEADGARALAHGTAVPCEAPEAPAAIAPEPEPVKEETVDAPPADPPSDAPPVTDPPPPPVTESQAPPAPAQAPQQPSKKGNRQ